MKKIFIALMLCAASVCTWAAHVPVGNSSWYEMSDNNQTMTFYIGSKDDEKWRVGSKTDPNNYIIACAYYESYTKLIIKAGNDVSLGTPLTLLGAVKSVTTVDLSNLTLEQALKFENYPLQDAVQKGVVRSVIMPAGYVATNHWSYSGKATVTVAEGTSTGTTDPEPSDPTESTEPEKPTSSVYQVPNEAKKHITVSSSFNTNDVCEIHPCKGNCPHSLSWILDKANITKDVQFDLVKIKLDNKDNKVTEALANINTYALDLTEVTNLDSWADVKNQYVRNVILPVTVGALYEEVKDNFNPDLLNNVIIAEKCTEQNCTRILMDAYINKPGLFANGLQYVSLLNPSFGGNASWYNMDSRHNGRGYGYDPKNITMLRVSGYVFARDLMANYQPKLTSEGHLPSDPQLRQYQNGFTYRPGQKCDNPLAPSYNDPNVKYFGIGEYGNQVGALMGAAVTNLDLTHAQFGEWVEENGKKVFKYYPGDMTVSLLFEIDKNQCISDLKLPTAPTQYVIPEGFLHDSRYIHEICIPSNFTEIGRFAFLGAKEGNNKCLGICHYTTTATEDDELKQMFNGIKKGDIIDYGDSTLTLPSTTKFVGRGAFSGYDGAALIQDVYVLAEKAPTCEFFAFDQKTYCGDNFHHVGHLIRKGNYVGANMAMLHFPHTTDRIEMLNYSDMTRHYRLYDETGHYDNVGNILVWPTKAQYNRSFNQALAGVTWWAWKENLEYETDKNGNIIYEYQIDEKGDTLKDVNGNPLYKYRTDDNGNIVMDENGNPIKIAKYKDDPENAYSATTTAGTAYQNANHEYLFTKAAIDDAYSYAFIEQYQKNPHSFFDGTESKGSVNSDLAEWDTEMLTKSIATSPTDRPLTYDWVKYGGWHQFVISELYDFMLDDPNPDPDVPKPDYFNFAKYNKNVWYAVCFPFNLTKAQFRKAFGDPEHDKDPYLSTLAGVTRNADQLKITVHMSSNLLENKIVYDENCPNTVKCDASTGFKEEYEPVEYGEDDIVVEANKPYFVLPCLPKEELIKAATGYRRSEITTVKTDETDDIKNVQFPIPLHVHAVNGTNTAFATGVDSEATDTTYAYNYYFVGNYIPQTMPMYAYYVGLTKKSNGDWWSSFFRMTPGKNKTWEANSAIVMAMVEDEANQSKSKGFLGSEESITSNLVWKAQPHNDWVFFEGTGKEAYTKNAFGMQVDSSNFTTSIQLPEDFKPSEDQKVYNLNGQYVGTTFGNFAKGIYIVGGKKVVVK